MRSSFLRGLLLNGGGAGTVAAVALVRNVLVARVMGPAAFGLWQVCLICLRLAGELHVGALNALALDGPVLRGAGSVEEARDLERRSLGVSALFAAAGGVVAGLALRLDGGPALGVAAVLLCLAVFGQQVFQAHAVLLQSRRQFGRMALLQVTFAVVHLGGLLALLPSRYITGALVAWVAGAFSAVALVRVLTRDPIPLPRPPGAAGIGGTVRRGLPTYLVGAAFVLLLQMDRLVVAALLGKGALGQYGVLALGGSALLFLPDVIAGALWPFAGEQYGRSGRDAAALRPIARATLRALALALAAGLVLVAQGTEVLVVHVLPGYAPSLDAVRLYLPGIFLLGLVHPLRLLIVTAGGDRALLRLFAAMLGVAALAAAGAALKGGTIAGVALAGTISSGLLFLLVLRLAARHLGLGRDAVRAGLECGVLLALALAVDFALGHAGLSLRTVPGVLLRVGLPALALLGAGAAVLRIRERLPQDPGTA